MTFSVTVVTMEVSLKTKRSDAVHDSQRGRNSLPNRGVKRRSLEFEEDVEAASSSSGEDEAKDALKPCKLPFLPSNSPPAAGPVAGPSGAAAVPRARHSSIRQQHSSPRAQSSPRQNLFGVRPKRSEVEEDPIPLADHSLIPVSAVKEDDKEGCEGPSPVLALCSAEAAPGFANPLLTRPRRSDVSGRCLFASSTPVKQALGPMAAGPSTEPAKKRKFAGSPDDASPKLRRRRSAPFDRRQKSSTSNSPPAAACPNGCNPQVVVPPVDPAEEVVVNTIPNENPLLRQQAVYAGEKLVPEPKVKGSDSFILAEDEAAAAAQKAGDTSG